MGSTWPRHEVYRVPPGAHLEAQDDMATPRHAGHARAEFPLTSGSGSSPAVDCVYRRLAIEVGRDQPLTCSGHSVPRPPTSGASAVPRIGDGFRVDAGATIATGCLPEPTRRTLTISTT